MMCRLINGGAQADRPSRLLVRTLAVGMFSLLPSACLLAALLSFVSTCAAADESTTPKATDRNAVVRRAAVELMKAVDSRYAEVAASSSAYSKALDKVVTVRINIKRDSSGTLDAQWVKDMGEAYLAVAEACRVCAEDADRIDGDDWPTRYEHEVADLNKKRQEDTSKYKRAKEELEMQSQMPKPKRAVDEISHEGLNQTIVEQTQIRLKAYEETLAIFVRMDNLVKGNDRIVATYSRVFRDMEESYREYAKTMFVVYKLQKLREIEGALSRISKQPSLLLDQVLHAKHEWDDIRQDIQKIIGD